MGHYKNLKCSTKVQKSFVFQLIKVKEQKQKEVDELVARDLECKKAAETVKQLELELKEKEAKQKERQEIEKELKKKEAVEAERDALQSNLADLNKTKDHLKGTIEKLRSEQKSVQDQLILLDAPLENRVIETKAELQESIANEKKSLEDLKIKFEQLETSMSSKKASDNRFKAEIQRQHKEMMKPMSEKLEAKSSDLEKITMEVDKLKQKCKSLQTKRDGLKKSKSDNISSQKSEISIASSHKSADKFVAPAPPVAPKADPKRFAYNQKSLKEPKIYSPKSDTAAFVKRPKIYAPKYTDDDFPSTKGKDYDPYDIDMDVDHHIPVTPSVKKFFKAGRGGTTPKTPKRVSFSVPKSGSAGKKAKLDKNTGPKNSFETKGIRTSGRNRKKLYSADAFELMTESP